MTMAQHIPVGCGDSCYLSSRRLCGASSSDRISLLAGTLNFDRRFFDRSGLVGGLYGPQSDGFGGDLCRWSSRRAVAVSWPCPQYRLRAT
jgi:hypothetical protein